MGNSEPHLPFQLNIPRPGVFRDHRSDPSYEYYHPSGMASDVREAAEASPPFPHGTSSFGARTTESDDSPSHALIREGGRGTSGPP